MHDPCYYCTAPKRYPGCHDHCETLKAHRESDEYKKLQEYKNTYLKGFSKCSTSIDSNMRHLVREGRSLRGYRYAIK